MNTNYELCHHGILGMKWGIRRYQNEDGSLTDAGKKRYASNYSEQQRTRDRKLYGSKAVNRINKRMLKGETIQSARHNEVEFKQRKEKGKALARTVAKSALVVGGAAAVVKIMKSNGLESSFGLENEVVKVGRKVIDFMI